MSDLQYALVLAENFYDGTDYHFDRLTPDEQSTIVEAARKYANIHSSRLHEWHILHVKPASWGLTHPLDCDLTKCTYQNHAETWVDPPDELGNYQWEHEPVLESWTALGITEPVG